MPLGVLTRCWAQLAGVLGGEKISLGSSIIIKNYPALSLVNGRWDGMDAGGAQWMTYSIYSTHHPSPRLGIVLVVGDFG